MTEKTFPLLPPYYVREMEDLVLQAGPLPASRDGLMREIQQTLTRLDDERHWAKRTFHKVKMAMCLEKLRDLQ